MLDWEGIGKFEQIIYINIDDSGKLVSSEKVAVYAGVVFTSKREKDKFITQYRSIVQELKCRYCKTNIEECEQNISCPELKHNMLKPEHNRQLMNYIKKYMILCCVINNDKVYSNQKSEKSYLIQASDLVAGTVRNLYLRNSGDAMEFSKRTEFINYKIFLTK